ncbi:LLM class flavin-dependent oxidoreductase [Microbacterium marinilacus]|uniref:LLM class flavin-dependent oxidoreductase n=1 Tax=Microbacterium marinilacus TaxID=415209 RepID=A0ABP7BEE0_9MICO|nr:LLM class flavin-dependent oxidoreductase [Microbacterium marinilacus]MBY0688888.1 LLM class flavin-dependent oxidoreductase [Microbacterium marinilacus]
MKKIGFLSFGHWSDARGSRVRSAEESLRQSLELAVAAEEIGIAAAHFRVHHFAAQQSSPLPLLATIAARTSRLEVGTGVIDMRYEAPLHLAEEAASLDLLSGGRVQLGIGRGSPEAADRGYQRFGHTPRDDESPADLARRHTASFLSAIGGDGIATPAPESGRAGALLPITPVSPGLRERVLWGAGNLDTALWAARQGMQLMSSTVIIDDKGIPFEHLQREQIDGFRSAWREAAWPWEPRVTVVRSIVPLVDDLSRAYFGADPRRDEGSGVLQGLAYRFGGSFTGEPEELVERLRADSALAAADTVLITIPNQLGVDYNARQLAAVHAIGRELGWHE